jgi:hypothetical protein
VRESGRKVVVVIAPDKSTIYPEFLPPDLPMRACMVDGRAQLWKHLEQSREPSLLPLRQAVTSARSDFDHRIYFRTDSHWNSAGSSVLVRAVVARVGTSKIPASAVVAVGKRPHTGDLGGLLGAPEEETEHAVEIRSPGTRLPGRIVFVHDSFGEGPLGSLDAQATDLSTAMWANDSPTTIIKAIAGADTVILETVEREVTYRGSAILTPAFFRQLEIALAKD